MPKIYLFSHEPATQKNLFLDKSSTLKNCYRTSLVCADKMFPYKPTAIKKPKHCRGVAGGKDDRKKIHWPRWDILYSVHPKL